MREIRFRAWTNNTFINEGMVYDYQDKTYVETFGFNNEELPLMQFTGLHDKNGTEIYEEDILKSPSSYDRVFWDEDGWSIEVMKRHKKNGGWIVGHKSKGLVVHAKYSEVIGNKFEGIKEESK